MTETASPALLGLLASRRSVAPVALSGPGPSPEQLDTLLKTAARVPDHGKLAPWRFIVFEGEARERAGKIIAEQFKSANPDAPADRVSVEARRLAHAPLVVAVVSRAAPHVKIPEWEQVMSAGAVCMTLGIAVKAMGFSCAWLTEWYAYDRAILNRLGLAPHEKIAGFVHIGHASGVPEDRVRPVLDEIVSRF